MSDIPNAYQDSNLDRSDLNVGNNRGKNKKAMLVIFTSISVIIIIVAIAFFMNAIAPKDKSKGKNDVTSNEAITKVESSSIANNDNFFDALKARKDREKAEEAARMERDKRLEIAAKKASKPVVIQRTYNEPKPVIAKQPTPTQPTPQAQQGQGRNQKVITPEMRKMDSTMMIPIGSSSATSSTVTETDTSYNVPAFENGFASNRGKGGLDFLLPHGSSIPCALYTQIISDYEGFVMCRVIQDVYSANGAVLLIERGSLVSGRQKVALEQGKSRLFTNWSDVETPNGISVQINSLGAGRLGASGSEAWIDNHFMQRFGGAILLSFIDDALAALADQASSDTGITYDNSTKNGNDMASKALESSINIKPTGYSKIGQRINIIVARDIDFSTVYEFEQQ